MRIHLTLKPSLFASQSTAGPSSGPLARLGDEVVLIELQGELGWEGEKEGGVVGVLGFDRPVSTNRSPFSQLGSRATENLNSHRQGKTNITSRRASPVTW